MLTASLQRLSAAPSRAQHRTLPFVKVVHESQLVPPSTSKDACHLDAFSLTQCRPAAIAKTNIRINCSLKPLHLSYCFSHHVRRERLKLSM